MPWKCPLISFTVHYHSRSCNQRPRICRFEGKKIPVSTQYITKCGWAFDNQSWKVSSLNIEISKSHAFLKMYSVDTAHGCQHHVPRIIDKNMVTSKLREVNKTNCMSFYSHYFSSVSIKNSCSSQHITRLLVMCQKSHTMLLGRCILIRYVWKNWKCD